MTVSLEITNVVYAPLLLVLLLMMCLLLLSILLPLLLLLRGLALQDGMDIHGPTSVSRSQLTISPINKQ
jgi:hypothetical protein